MRKFAGISCWVLVVAGLGGCSGNDKAPPAAPTLDAAVVRGRVLAADYGAVPRALVRLVAGTYDSEATTDSAGAYTLTGVPRGNYRVLVTLPPGFEPPSGRAFLPGGRTFVAESALQVTRADVERDLSAIAVLTASPDLGAGVSDTLVTAGGVVLVLRAGTVGAGTVVVRQVATPRVLDGHRTLAPSLTLKFAAAAGRVSGDDRGAARVSSVPAARLVISVGSLALSATKPALLWIKARLGAGQPDVEFWATPTATTVTVKGLTQTIPLASFAIDPGSLGELDVTPVSASTTCSGPTTALRPDATDTEELGSRIPLILIHGWQWDMFDCGHWEDWMPKTDPFAPLITHVTSEAGIRTHYKTYLFRYFSANSVRANADDLATAIASAGLSRPVIVGHSMGGLMGRALMARKGSDAVRALLTLGTPHAGSPLADIIHESPIQALSTRCWDVAVFFTSILPNTDGAADLRPNSPLITLLADQSNQPRDRVFTFGGAAPELTDPLYKVSGCLVSERQSGSNDGIVPLASALPSWSALQIRRDGYDHTEMAKGEQDRASDPLFVNIRSVLNSLVDCAPPPARPTSNAFPFSASLVRGTGRTVDVTVNPIIIAGRVINSLNEANFEVIENGCSKRLEFTTASRPVDVDIAFIQDLSGSMGSSITGVRNSVLAFASDLQSRGLAVRLASVGFSGPGTIASTPATSNCEYLGPVRDFTDAVTFSAHVTASWRATRGCDVPENGLEAIEYAHDSLDWRPGAARVYILIADASLHTRATSCNAAGACTNHDLSSITALVGAGATMHVVANASATRRSSAGGLDPWALADSLGGRKLTLGVNGDVDLIGLNIASVIGQVVRLTYSSTSDEKAMNAIRIRVSIPGEGSSEISPGLTLYRASNTKPAGTAPR